MTPKQNCTEMWNISAGSIYIQDETFHEKKKKKNIYHNAVS